MKLEKKIVIITGVSTGIGNVLSHQLLDKQCRVFGLGLHEPDIQHENFTFISTNIREYEQVKSSIDKIKTITNNRIDIVINNSGLGYFGFTENVPVEQFQEMFEVNVFGMFYILKEIIGILKMQRSGHIINISSTAGLEGQAQVSVYCATKYAVKGLSESLFKELRDFNIKVTCVYPGSTKTEFFKNAPGIQPHDKMLSPDDVAKQMIYCLESPDNFNINNLEIRPSIVK